MDKSAHERTIDGTGSAGYDRMVNRPGIEERGADKHFLNDLRSVLRAFPADRLDDAFADAQAACLAIGGDVALAGAQAAGYAEMHQAAERGLEILQRLVLPEAAS
jgi:hypothetical protein